MQLLFGMAPPMMLPERLIVACLGFALTLTLSRRVVGTTPTGFRILTSLVAVLAAVLGSSLLADDRSIRAFLVGAIGGVLAVPRSLYGISPSLQRSRWLPVACLALGPLLGIALFVVSDLTETISPLDHFFYFAVFLTIGSFAGLVSAGIVGIAVFRSLGPKA